MTRIQDPPDLPPAPPEHEGVLRAIDPRTVAPLTRAERRDALERRMLALDDELLMATLDLRELREPGEDDGRGE